MIDTLNISSEFDLKGEDDFLPFIVLMYIFL